MDTKKLPQPSLVVSSTRQDSLTEHTTTPCVAGLEARLVDGKTDRLARYAPSDPSISFANYPVPLDESGGTDALETEFDSKSSSDEKQQKLFVGALIEQFDGLSSDFSMTVFADHLIDTCSRLISNVEVSLVLADDQGLLCVAGSTCERIGLLTKLQIDYDQGPIIDAYRRGREIVVPFANDDDDRWPTYAPLARAMRYQSVNCFPLHHRSETIGVLCVARMETEPVPHLQSFLMRALAECATVGIQHQRKYSSMGRENGQLRSALQSRILIEQAKGFGAARLGITPDEAFALLRQYARGHNRKLVGVAEDVVNNKLVVDVFPVQRK